MENIYTLWSDENRQYHSPTQFLPLVPLTFLAIAMRCIIQTFLIKPMGIYLGIPPDLPAYPSVLLEKTSKPSKLTRFTTSCKKLIWYSFIWTFGVAVLWNKPWLWDINASWTDFGNDPVTIDLFLYGNLTVLYYSSELLSQLFLDVRRKDFWIMFIHHITAIAVVAIIWIFKLHRIGSLAPLLHDVNDIIVELSKCLKCLKYPKWPEIFFEFFAISWVITRLIILPFWYIRACLEDSQGALSQASVYYVWNGLFLVLMFLHCIWTVMIFKVIRMIIQSGSAVDIRSRSESCSEEESDKDD
ncbi:ceramide synthase 5 isoform X1 [Diabrotica virgifera virgifera]|uniref:TLC domain-containing protein n=1 Tax=Diabrotica virgifera virgifera TaxID=50390 RepID=A0ABM5JRI9_DIAVI|nr:ceramide synthase 5 isoform X1 [Diabrotica virgifera virgifera]